ncbi:DUF1285 domain-containing protein [Psychrobacter arenosus]|uniref:DUF1285 domain-containing protein n=1 Tax=Psychrobacter arenosus TaxID=256326 RepID=UPI00191A4E38|nr:DUF1285 domain-containing protein [Psychrobacter arenosus]
MTDSTIKNSDNNIENNNLNSIDGLSQYLKSQAGSREGRAIPPLDKWHPTNIDAIDIVIKANGDWWHESTLMTRQSLVSLFASILWTEKNSAGESEYYLKTPVQMLRITVEDAPLLINDVGVVVEEGVNWLEFTTTTGDVVRLDKAHTITLTEYQPEQSLTDKAQVRPYMPVRNGLNALIGRNAFYHLTELGELSEQAGETVLTLQSGGETYTVSVPSHSAD